MIALSALTSILEFIGWNTTTTAVTWALFKQSFTASCRTFYVWAALSAGEIGSVQRKNINFLAFLSWNRAYYAVIHWSSPCPLAKELAGHQEDWQLMFPWGPSPAVFVWALERIGCSKENANVLRFFKAEKRECVSGINVAHVLKVRDWFCWTVNRDEPGKACQRN